MGEIWGFFKNSRRKETIGKNGISFNNWSEIPDVAFMGSREQGEELALVTMRNLLS